MPIEVTKHYTLFKFDELSENAKAVARDWYRQGALDYEWWDSVYEGVSTAGALLGIEFNRKVRGGLPSIYFTGFSSQGDGACFEGEYSYRKGWKKAVKAEFGGQWQEELIRLGMALQDAQAPHFYKLEAQCVQRGRYSHSGCMAVSVSHSEERYRDIGDGEADVTDALREFADWIYQKLESEHDWLLSDETVDESIRSNEYTFLSSGRRED